jgi:iron-sulfur cluster repair protein YtfE (RIC family)
MNFANRISQTLHEEHRATIALMERVEQLLSRYRRNTPPPSADQGVAQLMSELSIALEAEIKRHFAFEEESLFPYLQAAGDDAIGAHLTDEHNAIRPIGAEVAKLARDAAALGFDESTWLQFRRLGQELCDRLLTHVQKEEMALLPLLDEGMDAETEARLFQEYVENA